jgi:hypothetical protein
MEIVFKMLMSTGIAMLYVLIVGVILDAGGVKMTSTLTAYILVTISLMVFCLIYKTKEK